MKKLSLSLPKKKTSGRGDCQAPGRDTVQKWLPVQDISGGLMVRSDGRLVAVVRVEPAPFTLLSERERARRITALHEAIQALPGAAQVCAVSRPIDLDTYISGLEAMQVDTDGPRRALLRGYTNYVRGLVTSAGAVERRFYVLIPGDEKRKGAGEDLLQKAREFVAALSRAELQARMCTDQELMDLLFCFFHPAQAAFERADNPAIAPVYITAKDVIEHGID